jgi:hypothetical protein
MTAPAGLAADQLHPGVHGCVIASLSLVNLRLAKVLASIDIENEI